MSTLTKTACLMGAESKWAGRYRFAVRDEDSGQITRLLILSPEDFKDLGEPRQLTVTIEPGDMLNPA